MTQRSVLPIRPSLIVVLLTALLSGCGGGSGGNGGGGGGGGGNPPTAPTGVTAIAGNAQVALNWNASAGASSYKVSRATASGGPYSRVGASNVASYTDTAVANGIAYYYVVSASNTYGASANSAQVSATPVAGTAAVAVNIDVLANRHMISPFVYGNNDQTISDISDVGYTFSRWGGNDASNYNWQLQSRNSAGDYYFEDYGGAGDQAQLITDTQNAGGHALTTMAMMDWVAQASGWSFSVQAFGSQCSVDPYNTDAGNGLVAGSTGNCNTSTVPVTTNAVTTAYYPLVDTVQDCPAGTISEATCIDRQTWAQALATAFGSGTCAVPYSAITSCHFYDMDNEPDIWNGTHRDVHPAPTGYDEMAKLYEAEATNLKAWDPAAVRFGPVFCCWWFYWNGANGNDKAAHGGVDFLPWWLNQIYWFDQINGARTLDVFDIHAYADCGPTTNFTNPQLQAATVKCAAYYWDPATVNPDTNNTYTSNEEPNPGIPFHIPRFKAMANAIYPGTPLSYTEWGAGLAQNSGSDFSTALADADTLGAFGREGLSFASRWGGPSPGTAEYLAWKMYTNYDGRHDGFGTMSVSDTNNGNSNLFSSYAALNSTGTTMTVMVLNKDPGNAAQVTFNLPGFNPSTFVAYTLASTASGTIQASNSAAWNSSQSFSPYSITLLVINGSEASTAASDWYLNPDALMIPASGKTTLHPALSSGSATVTLSSAVFDAYEGAPACSGTLALSNATITAAQTGTITVNAGSTPGFCHYTVTGSDGTATQTQGGWIVVGNPPASLAKTAGDGQSAPAGTVLNLSVTLTPAQSGGGASGASVFFTTTAGSLQNVQVGPEQVFTGSKVIAVTNSSGVASVKLTLPGTSGTQVQITAEGQYAVGHPIVIFTEMAQ
jgi:hypothetical protein